jgi:hypothetical protein
MSILTALKEGSGPEDPFSIRRILAVYFSGVVLASIICIFASLDVILTATSWGILALIIGGVVIIPAAVVILLLFFTTWADIRMIIAAAKDNISTVHQDGYGRLEKEYGSGQ